MAMHVLQLLVTCKLESTLITTGNIYASSLTMTEFLLWIKIFSHDFAYSYLKDIERYDIF